MKINILDPYKLIKKKVKDYGAFVLYQVWGIKENQTEMTPLYKVCEWK